MTGLRRRVLCPSALLTTLLALLLAGCIPQASSVPEVTSTRAQVTVASATSAMSAAPAATHTTFATSPRLTRTPANTPTLPISTSLPTDTPRPSPVPETVGTPEAPIPPATPSPQVTALSDGMRQCQQISQEIALYPSSGGLSLPRSFTITSVKFVGETLLRVSGWGSSGDGWSAVSEVVFDLETGRLTERETPHFSPLPAICQECGPYIFDQSPQGNYQLAIYRKKKVGIWIVSSTQATRVSDFTPWLVDGVWAEDESWVWFKWTGMESGMDSAFARVGTDIQAEELPLESPLSEMGHRIAVNPVGGVAVSASSGSDFTPNGELGRYDLGGTAPVLLQTHSVRETLDGVAWDKDKRQFVLSFVEDNGVVIEFLDEPDKFVAPKNVSDHIFGGMAGLKNDYSTSGALIAVSPLRTHVTLAHDKIYVLSCD